MQQQRQWSVRLTEFDLSAVREGKHVEKNLQVGVLVVTQDPEGGLHLVFLPESRG